MSKLSLSVSIALHIVLVILLIFIARPSSQSASPELIPVDLLHPMEPDVLLEPEEDQPEESPKPTEPANTPTAMAEQPTVVSMIEEPKESSPTPTNTQSPTATNTRTRTPTNTPTTTKAPATATATPTNTPSPTATEKPKATATPTVKKPKPTPTNTRVPKPSPTTAPPKPVQPPPQPQEEPLLQDEDLWSEPSPTPVSETAQPTTAPNESRFTWTSRVESDARSSATDNNAQNRHQGVSFESHYSDWGWGTSLQQALQPHWQPPGLPSAVLSQLRAQARLVVSKDGRILERSIVQSSGVNAFDQQVLAAIDNMGRAPALSATWSGTQLGVRVWFLAE